MNIADMDFVVEPWDKRMSTRVKNKLQRHGVFTLDQLVACDRAWLRDHLGVVEYAIVKAKLKSLGHNLKRG